MDIRNDGSMSTLYFSRCLSDFIKEPSIKGFFKKKMKDYELNEGTVLICKPEVSSTNWLRKEIDRCHEWMGNDLSVVTVVIVDYFADSKIQEKFIHKRILKGLKISQEPKVITVHFDESDFMQILEDGYDDRFSYKGMSKAYRRCLSQVRDSYMESKTITEKKGKGVSYEDRSLV